MAKESSQIPANTYDMTLKFRITLPPGETPEQQDPSLVVTGECYDPWPGVHIHDVDFVSAEPVR